MMENTAGAFWDRLRAEMTAIAGKIVDQRLQNHRPRGATSVPLTVGSPGTSLVTGLWIPGAKIHFPVLITEVHLSAANASGPIASDTTFDIWIQRPGQTGAEAASIVNGNYPRLYSAGAVQEIVINPVMAPLTGPGPVWTTNFIEADSLIWVYVTVTDGIADMITLNLGPRCV